MKFLSFLFLSTSLLFAESVKEHEERINKMEEALKKEVALYNERLKNGETTTHNLVHEPELKKSRIEIPDHISSDQQVLQEQVKQLLDAVQHLQKDVEDIKKGDTKKSKKSSSKKKQKAVKPPVDMSVDGQKLFEGEKLIDKDPEKAITELSKVAEACNDSPNGIHAALLIGKAYLKLAKWDLAIKTAESVLSNENHSVYQEAEAMLLKASAQHKKNDRVHACKTLDNLEWSNIELAPEQNDRYQEMVIDNDCSSKMDRDKKEEAANEEAEEQKERGK